MDFTIVTPSFRQLERLANCVASVADQEGVRVEHMVQDGGTDEFALFSQRMSARWPDRPDYRRIMESRADRGMYDAINRGLMRATGYLCAYLNCDEQYLPGVLKMVRDVFENSPQVDLLLGDVVVVDPRGNPVCLRKMVTPSLAHTWTCHFAGLSAGIFFRRSLVERGFLFDSSYRVAADAEWYVRLLQSRIRAKALGKVTSIFREDGGNLGMSPAAQQERDRLNQSAPRWMMCLRPWWVVWHRWRRCLAGCHRKSDQVLDFYTSTDGGRRRVVAPKLRTTWPGRTWGY